MDGRWTIGRVAGSGAAHAASSLFVWFDEFGVRDTPGGKGICIHTTRILSIYNVHCGASLNCINYLLAHLLAYLRTPS